MSIAPLFTSPCDLAERIPSLISDFLELENKIGRRFREDSVTDVLIASLLRVAGSNAIVLTPPEVKTGGDFDILIVEPSTSDAIQYRIQAKRLTPHPTKWHIGSYQELAHPHNSGKQASTLLRSSAHESIKTLPLYAFYNPEAACLASDGTISGIELASGREISRIVKAMVKAKPRRLPHKRVGSLQPLFFPLTTILCPPINAGPTSRSIISPSESRRAAEAAMRERQWFDQLDDETMSLPLARQERLATPTDRQRSPISSPPSRVAPVVEQRFPRLIERAIRHKGGAQIRTARVKRTKVLLISDSTAGSSAGSTGNT